MCSSAMPREVRSMRRSSPKLPIGVIPNEQTWRNLCFQYTRHRTDVKVRTANLFCFLPHFFALGTGSGAGIIDDRGSQARVHVAVDAWRPRSDAANSSFGPGRRYPRLLP